jgi:hypothetical protein
MSKESEYMIHHYEGKEFFNIISDVSDKEIDCNICWYLCASKKISIKLSTRIWPCPIDDPYMVICNNCIHKHVTYNHKYIVYGIMNKIYASDIADMINEYI